MVTDRVVADDPFRGVLPFVLVAEERSFRRAAVRLGVTPAAVSKAVARLERALGAPLFVRTSRHVALTHEGALLFDRGREAVRQLRVGRDQVAEARQVAAGTLRVSMPHILGPPVVAHLAVLFGRHPGLRVELRMTDRLARLAEEEIDVAVRMGELPDSALVSRLVGRPRWTLVASPEYLARHGTPRQPEELADHDGLLFLLPRGTTRTWVLRDAPPVEVRPRLVVDQGQLLVEAAVSGAGIAQVFEFMVADLVRAGRLVTVLPEQSSDGPAIHALTLPRRGSAPRIRALLEFLTETLAPVGIPSSARRGSIGREIRRGAGR